MRAYDPTLPTITSIPNILRCILLYSVGLAPFIDYKCDAFGIDVRAIGMDRINKEKALAGFPQWVKNVIGWAFAGTPPAMCMLPKLFAVMRKRGVPVYFLGVETAAQVRNAIENGASGFLTDKPNELCRFMKMNGVRFNSVDQD